MKPPHTQSDKRRGAKAGKQSAAQSGTPLEEQAGATGDQRSEVDLREEAGERVAARPNSGEDLQARPSAAEENGMRPRADRNPRGRGEPGRQAMQMPGRAPGRRAGSGLGWLRWALLLPVVGFTVWVAAGILTHGLNGSWRGEESFYAIEPDKASGAGHTGAGHSGGGAAKSAAAGNGASDAAAPEPAWKNPATWTDSFGDGTPDFLRLTGEADREAFRQWFVLIADYQATRPAAQVPKEITDCASLLRYAYREALKKHDAGWIKDSGIELGALPGDLSAWHYPDTPLGAGLFRVTAGPFERGDEGTGAFAPSADAKTLVERNAYLVSRNVWQAEPGDLLFYRQLGQSSPWQSMIVTRVGSDAAVVYDSGEDQSLPEQGPVGGDSDQSAHGQGPVPGDSDHGAPGELRRVELTDLLGNPQAEWRPLASNPNFMGVYRWNILRGSL